MLSAWVELALKLHINTNSNLDGSKTRIPTGMRPPPPSVESLALRETHSPHNSYVLAFLLEPAVSNVGRVFYKTANCLLGSVMRSTLFHTGHHLSVPCVYWPQFELLLKGELDQDFQRLWVSLKTTVAEYARGNISEVSFSWRVFSMFLQAMLFQGISPWTLRTTSQFLKSSFANSVILPVIWVSQLHTWHEPCMSSNWTGLWMRKWVVHQVS